MKKRVTVILAGAASLLVLVLLVTAALFVHRKSRFSAQGNAQEPKTEMTETMSRQTETMSVQTEKIPVQTETISVQTETIPVQTETMPVQTEMNAAQTESEEKTEGIPQMSEKSTENQSEMQTERGEIVSETPEKAAERIMQGMTLEEKAAQVIITTPESLTGYDQVTAAGEATRASIEACPVGGLVYFENNLITPEQTTEMIKSAQQYSKDRIGLPLWICVDEEGGSVTRIAGNDSFGVTDVGDMYYLGQAGDSAAAFEAGEYIGSYLKRLGFNVNFAPVADVLTNPDNPVVKMRSFGSSAMMDASMTAAFVDGSNSAGILSCLKHFPGHGNTGSDSHEGIATTNRTMAEMQQCEWIPFVAGINAGCPMVMIGHIDTPGLTTDGLPSSLSQAIISEMLKGKLGFKGLIITDALNMGSITNRYTSYQAAQMALNAGVDILLMPADLSSAISGIVEGVQDGTISAERLDNAVRKNIIAKLKM